MRRGILVGLVALTLVGGCQCGPGYVLSVDGPRDAEKPSAPAMLALGSKTMARLTSSDDVGGGYPVAPSALRKVTLSRPAVASVARIESDSEALTFDVQALEEGYSWVKVFTRDPRGSVEKAFGEGRYSAGTGVEVHPVGTARIEARMPQAFDTEAPVFGPLPQVLQHTEYAVLLDEGAVRLRASYFNAEDKPLGGWGIADWASSAVSGVVLTPNGDQNADVVEVSIASEQGPVEITSGFEGEPITLFPVSEVAAAAVYVGIGGVLEPEQVFETTPGCLSLSLLLTDAQGRLILDSGKVPMEVDGQVDDVLTIHGRSARVCFAEPGESSVRLSWRQSHSAELRVRVLEPAVDEGSAP